MVECQLPKLDVAGSTPVARSTRLTHPSRRVTCLAARPQSSGAFSFRWRSGKTVLLFLARLAVGRGRRRGTGASATLWRGRGDR